jgi:hypothetical protein
MIKATDVFFLEIQVFVFVKIPLRNGRLNSISVAVQCQVFLGPLYGLKYSRDNKPHNS